MRYRLSKGERLREQDILKERKGKTDGNHRVEGEERKRDAGGAE